MVWWWCIGCLFAAMSQLLDVTVFHVEANPRKMCSTPKKGQVENLGTVGIYPKYNMYTGCDLEILLF